MFNVIERPTRPKGKRAIIILALALIVLGEAIWILLK